MISRTIFYYLNICFKVINIFDYQPLGYIEPEYIAFIVEFLLSEKSKYITGSFIPVSAGMDL